ncbi:hypothetical protein G7K_1442-t1 [Saitoella complicata NRRL Y-17804]|uniref:40S ribosomal protein S17 n=1 Tax=Saitoella complicata (strain BCRC 22490 / CBS 7301 / JCM 7358 / NBRC 10748 / NRRL Y-17804) TaxID=698492 RepID=A0A0E9NBH7_SAICN|nr:hypothetical protein G7K_1442-t1 [Saitoella complicata NRRL Y-17804]
MRVAHTISIQPSIQRDNNLEINRQCQTLTDPPSTPLVAAPIKPRHVSMHRECCRIILNLSSVWADRKQGQGSSTELQQKDLKAELLRAEEEAKAKKSGKALPVDDPAPALAIAQSGTEKHALTEGDEEEESPEAKRRRILEESKDLDADDSDEEKDDEDDEHDSDEDSDDDDDEDETAALLAELAKIKAERAAAAQKLASENAAAEDDARVESIALGNPLLNPDSFKVKKRWDEDVIFRNQARGADLDGRGGKKGFVNDLLRNGISTNWWNSVRLTPPFRPSLTSRQNGMCHCCGAPQASCFGRVRTKTVKRASRVLIEKYYPRLTLDFHTNKRTCDEVAIIASKRLRNKIAGFTTHLMKRIQRGPVRGISFKLQEEERERKGAYLSPLRVLVFVSVCVGTHG